MCSKMTKSILGLRGGTSFGDSRMYLPKAGFRLWSSPMMALLGRWGSVDQAFWACSVRINGLVKLFSFKGLVQDENVKFEMRNLTSTLYIEAH